MNLTVDLKYIETTEAPRSAVAKWFRENGETFTPHVRSAFAAALQQDHWDTAVIKKAVKVKGGHRHKRYTILFT